jgi:hypothetical protein
VPVHTLDTCALSDLAEHSEFALARHRLLDEVAASRIVVLGTAPLLWELPALHEANPCLFDACFDLLYRITRGRVLLNPVVRQEHEVRARGPLGHVADVDPSQKAKVLAQGISDAMNYTAAGLVVQYVGCAVALVAGWKVLRLCHAAAAPGG